MSETEPGDYYDGRLADLTQAWAEIVRHVNPELDIEEVRLATRALARSLLAVVTAHPLDLDAAREVGTKLEVWEHLELTHLLEMQHLALQYLTHSEGQEQDKKDASGLTLAVLALGHGFYEARVERAQRLGMDSMSRMSHDLKTPINAITGFSKVILKGIDGPITDFQQEDLTSIYEAGNKLLVMVNDLFTVRKRDAQRPVIYGESFEVATLFADVIRTIQPSAAESGYRLIVELDGILGSMTADPSMVRWVLLGLLMYLMRETGQGILHVLVRREQDVEGPRLCVRIGFEGSIENQGLAEAEVGDVSDLTRDDLVLHTCLNFCETLGGELTRIQSPGGVSFRIVLPVRPSEAPNVDSVS